MIYSFFLFTFLNVSSLGQLSSTPHFQLPQPPVAFALFLQVTQETEKPKEEKKKPAIQPDADAKKPDEKKEPALKQATDDADDETKKDEKGEEKKPVQQSSWKTLLPMMLAAFAFFYFIILRPQKRDKEKRQNLLDSMKKNDRVVTIGGIIGTIANVSQDGNEITLKLDDNARVKMLRSSISGPYQPAGEDKDDTSK